MRPAVCALVCVTILLAGPLVHAHEIGTTRVSVVFSEDRTYRIDVVTDAAALVDKIESAASRSPSTATIDPVDLRARLQGLDHVFRRRLGVTFDGSVVRPAIDYSVAASSDAAAPPVATVRLSGDIPAQAREFAWTYSWTFASYALTVRRVGSNVAATEWLEGGQIRSFLLTELTPPVSGVETARRYLALGFTHIVPKGLDHMLFVLGIFLLTRRLRSVLWQVSAFTIAHSITLGLSMYGVISVAPRLVEPLIAMSIAYVAVENLFMSELKPRRVALIFAFGLLHGMGFAGALKELGLPRSEFVTALLTFNVGVEAGQLAVIGVAFLAVGWYCGAQVWYRRRVVIPASAVMAGVAVYWTLQRLSL